MGEDMPRQIHFSAESYAVEEPACDRTKASKPKVEKLTDIELEAISVE